MTVPKTPDLAAMAGHYAMLADEFLRAYFVLGLNGVRLHARYFVMAHCLELAFKASLANRAVAINYATHDLDYLEEQLVLNGNTDIASMRPDQAAKEVFDRMFNPTVSNFVMQDWLDHREALEILVCYAHSADLKYGMDKSGEHILTVTPSTSVMNARFLGYIASARQHFPDRGESGREIVDFVARIASEFPPLFSRATTIIK